MDNRNSGNRNSKDDLEPAENLEKPNSGNSILNFENDESTSNSGNTEKTLNRKSSIRFEDENDISETDKAPTLIKKPRLKHKSTGIGANDNLGSTEHLPQTKSSSIRFEKRDSSIDLDQTKSEISVKLKNNKSSSSSESIYKTAKLMSGKNSSRLIPKNTDKIPKLVPERSLIRSESESNLSRLKPNENLAKQESEDNISQLESTLSLVKPKREESFKQRSLPSLQMSKKKLKELVSDIKISVPETGEDPIFPEDNNQSDDFIVDTIGEFGPSQLLLFLLMDIARINVTMHKQAIIYFQTPVRMACTEISIKDTSINLQFKNTIFLEERFCNNKNCTVIFDTSVFDETLITEFNLICERYYLSDLQHTVLTFGTMIGSFAFGYSASKYGRYFTFVFSCIMTSLFGLLTGLAPTIELLTIFRFLCGFGLAGLMVGYILLLESIGNKYRFLVSVFYQSGMAIGYILLTVFAYLIRNWRSWYMAISSPVAFLIIVYIIELKESPRWLMTKGYVDKCISTLEQIAKFNKKPIEHISYVVHNSHKKVEGIMHEEDSRYSTLFKSTLILKTITLCFAYVTNALTAYNTSNYYRKLDETVFTFNIALGLALLPGTILTIIVSKFKTLKFIALHTAILLTTAIVLLGFWENVTGKFIIAISYKFIQMIFQTTLLLLNGHLFPTTLRSQAQGLLQASANIGSMIAPYPLHLDLIASKGATTLYFFLWIASILLIQWNIPDDLGTEIPDTLSQVK